MSAALANRPAVYQPGAFNGQVVLVSGAGSGIGKVIAAYIGRKATNAAH